MSLDISSFSKAVAQLEAYVGLAESDIAGNDQTHAQALRAAAIQAFEFTYELALKTLRRYLEEADQSPETIQGMTFDEVIRKGFEEGLLNAEIADWRNFRKNRGTTSHGYDEDKAQFVYENIPPFLAEVRFLYAELERRLKHA